MVANLLKIIIYDPVTVIYDPFVLYLKFMLRALSRNSSCTGSFTNALVMVLIGVFQTLHPDLLTY